MLAVEQAQVKVAYHIINDKRAIAFGLFMNCHLYLLMERKYSLEGQLVFVKEYSVMSLERLPTLL